MLNVGIIGAGTFALEHAIALNNNGNLNLIAACRTSVLELESFCGRFGIRGYSNYKSLLADIDIDAVLIATPHHLHAPIAIEAAKAGKHILIEKPFASTMIEADEIIAAADNANIKLMIGHNMQFVPASTRAKELLKSMEVGNVVMGQRVMSKLWMDDHRKDWHLSKQSSGGLLLTAGIHYIDLLTFLIDSKVKSVNANVSAKFHQQESDDCAMLMLEYENGVVVNIMSLGYTNGVRKMEAELYCSGGAIKINSSKGVHIGKHEEWQLVDDSASENWVQESLVAQWSEFGEAILKDRSPQVNGSYARHIMEVIFAAFESSKSGKCIYILSDN